MKRTRYALTRINAGATIYYTGTGWGDLRRAAKRYRDEDEAIDLAQRMTASRKDAVYVQPVSR